MKSYDRLIEKIARQPILSLKMREGTESLIMDAFNDTIGAFDQWYGGGDVKYLDLSRKMACFSGLLMMSATLENGLLDPFLVSATAFLSTLSGSANVKAYRDLFYKEELMDKGMALTDFDKNECVAAANALDLACGNYDMAGDRLKELHKNANLLEMGRNNLLFALQECCIRKSVWPAAGVRMIQEELTGQQEERDISIWRVCVYQASLIVSQNNGLLPLAQHLPVP